MARLFAFSCLIAAAAAIPQADAPAAASIAPQLVPPPAADRSSGLTSASRPIAVADGYPQVLWRADDGLFYVDARINDTPVRLIVDTGASMIVLSPEDAQRVGATGAQGSAATAETVGGPSRLTRVRLSSIEVAGTSASDVSAVVASQPIHFSLLGQNWLSRLGSVTIEGDRMTLR